MTDMGWSYLLPADKATILRGVRDGVAYGGPYHVEIHPADRCNIDCFFCSTAAIRGTDEIPVERFEKLALELQQAGTRAVRLAGGGEPLFHRGIKRVLRTFGGVAIPVENITTNGVIIDDELAEILTETCDNLSFSLNTGDAETYATMMKTPARNFDRVIANVRRVVAARKQLHSRRPRVTIQFLVWRDNYRSIPQMYDLARELGADRILFNGIASLAPEQKMSDEQIGEMLRLYEGVLRRDEFRTIANVASYERDIDADIVAIMRRMGAERDAEPFARRIARFILRNDFSLAEKIRHRSESRKRAEALETFSEFDESCIVGWYSMLVRSSGDVGPCCVIQHKKLANVFTSSVAETWNSDAYRQFRRELTDIIVQRESWSASESDTTVEPLCGMNHAWRCYAKSFYFINDRPFVRSLGDEFRQLQRTALPAGEARV